VSVWFADGDEVVRFIGVSPVRGRTDRWPSDEMLSISDGAGAVSGTPWPRVSDPTIVA
jgi:hypothetical protein